LYRGGQFWQNNNHDTNPKGEPFNTIEERFISPASFTVRFRADSMDVDMKLKNNDSNFTYISGTFDHSGTMDILIKALNSDSMVVKNYSDGCYAVGGDLNITYDTIDTKTLNDLGLFMYRETALGFEDNVTFSSPLNIAIPSTTFKEGESDMHLDVNFQRDLTKAVNPFSFNVTNYLYKDNNSLVSNGTVSTTPINFYYGRVHSPNVIGESPLDVNMSYEIYINSSGEDIASIAGNISVDSVDWYINSKHSTLKSKLGLADDYTTLGDSNATNKTTKGVTLIYNGSELPYKDKVQISASDWLIYNKFNSDATTNNFSVEFISKGDGWSGIGEDANVSVDLNISKRTTRRLSW